eukprot:scaffold12971_cov68-Cyclotella_meneghiniana.AAC.17
MSTLPTSHYKYDEWLEKVEIGIWALKWSPQHDFQSRWGAKFAQPSPTFYTKTELIFEFAIHNHHYTLAFESWVTTISAPVPHVPHQDEAFFISFKNFTASQPFQHLIISMMNEWLEKVEIGIWALKWSPQHDFQSWSGSKFAWPLSTFHTKTELIFEFAILNHHNTLAFESWVVTISAPVPYVPHQDEAFSVHSRISQHVNPSNISL